jgi:hypothetical protein
MSPRLAALALLSLLALTGCGGISSQTATSSQSAMGTPAPIETQIAPTATITVNQVTLTTDRSTYGPGDTVRVTIGNGLSVSIYVMASGSACGELDLQVKGASGWQTADTAKCASQAEPDALDIRPGGALPLTIPAPAAGTYRFALQYTTITIPPPRSAPGVGVIGATNPASGPAVTVYSAPWEVRSA